MEVTWAKTATSNIMENKEPKQQSSCLPLTSIGRMKAGLLARFQTTGSLTSSALFDLLNQEGGFDKAMQETIYVGLDLGSSRCQQTVVGADGLVRFSRVIVTSEKSLRSAFEKLEGDVRVHLEAGELAGWVHSILRAWFRRSSFRIRVRWRGSGRTRSRTIRLMPGSWPSC